MKAIEDRRLLTVLRAMDTLEGTGEPKGDPLWATHDGRLLKVSEMEDSHINNARAWALRTAQSLDSWALRAYAYSSGAPDGAAMAADSEADGYMDRAANLRRWANHFSKELKLREKLRGGDDVR